MTADNLTDDAASDNVSSRLHNQRYVLENKDYRWLRLCGLYCGVPELCEIVYLVV